MSEQKSAKVIPSLKKNAALNMTKSVMSLLFPLITFPYSSRVLGPVYIGKVNFAQSIVSYFSLVAGLGITTYAIREAAKVRDNRENLSVFIKEIFSINMISTLAAYILFAVALFAVPLFENYRKLLCISGATILFTTLGMDYLYTALEDFKYITVRSICFQFLSLVLLFLLVHNQDDYLKYAAISVISSVGSNLLNFFHARHFVDFKAKVQNLKKHLKPIFTLFAMTAAISIYTVLDTTMLGFLKGDEAVGIYHAATKINRMVIMMITAATAVLLPRLSYYANSGDKTEFYRLSNKALQFVVLFSIPCAAGLFVLSESAVLLFSGDKYLPSVSVMKIMNAVIVFIAQSNLTGVQIFMAVGKEKVTLFSVVAGAIVNFTLNSILIPRYGAEGAAAATLIAEFCVTLIQILFARQFFDCKENLPHFVKVALASVVMSVGVYFVSDIFEHLALKIFAGIIFGILIYAACLFIFRDRFAAGILKEIYKKKEDTA